jgi:hypothetical protein
MREGEIHAGYRQEVIKKKKGELKAEGRVILHVRLLSFI